MLSYIPVHPPWSSMFFLYPLPLNSWPGGAIAQALLPVIDIRSRTRSRLWVVCTMIEIDEDLCKGCDICISFCPLKVLETSDKINRKGYYVPVAANCCVLPRPMDGASGVTARDVMPASSVVNDQLKPDSSGIPVVSVMPVVIVAVYV